MRSRNSPISPARRWRITPSANPPYTPSFNKSRRLLVGIAPVPAQFLLGLVPEFLLAPLGAAGGFPQLMGALANLFVARIGHCHHSLRGRRHGHSGITPDGRIGDCPAPQDSVTAEIRARQAFRSCGAV